MRTKLIYSGGALALLFLFYGCSEVNDSLGADMVPTNQKMEVGVAWFGSDEFGDNPHKIFDTSLFSTDSLPASRIGYATLGQTKDAAGVFGARKNSMILQFLPNSMPYDDTGKNYGLDPIVDSIYILLAHNEARGNTATTQNFDVYDLKVVPEIPLTRNETYRAKFDAEPLKGEKLFTFTHSGDEGIAAKMVPTTAGKAYLNRIVNLDWETYKSDAGFRENFEGLYITPADPAGTDGAAYTSELASSGMLLFVRNHDETDPSAIYDTLVTRFTFRDSDDYDASIDYTTPWDNVSINMTSFDYTGSAIGGLTIADDFYEDSPVPVDRAYVQTMGGVGTKIQFKDELIEGLKALKFDTAGIEHDILVNQALVYIDIADGSTPMLDNSIPRLGSYARLSALGPIPDYQYSAEVAQQAKDASYRLPYNGYLNRSRARYELDITSFVQRLIVAPDGEATTAFSLGPDATDLFGFGESVLLNDATNPIRMRITYTLININK